MIYAMDVEVYQNFFCVTFVNVEDQLDIESFVIFNDIDQRQELVKFLRQKTLVGYNILHFDNIILEAVKLKYTLSEIHILAQSIVNGMNYEQIKSLRNRPKNPTIDVMKIMAFDSIGIGLKQVAISLKFSRIQDLPIRYDEKITEDQVDIILDYNLNDVLITVELYHAMIEEIELRDKVGLLFGVDLSSASRSQMGSLILEKIYSEETGIDPFRFRGLRTDLDVVKVEYCIGKNIQFVSKTLRELLVDLQKLVLIKSVDFRFKRKVDFAGKIFDVGVGGLHSRDDPAIYESSDTMAILDADVDSFYPKIMLINDIKPRHLDGIFLDILRRLTESRLQAKKDGDKIKADAMKITINSIFGKLRSDTYWLYDPAAFFKVTVSGQLYLLMLIEYLHEAGFTILSANTDGVTCLVTDFDLYYATCKQWEQQTGFTLSHNKYLKYIRRDVNNYLVEMPNKIKAKGFLETSPNLEQGFKHLIVPKALNAYFLSGVPIEETIRKGRCIHDFLWTQKVHKKFDVYFNDEKLQKTNRYFASLSGGILHKVLKPEIVKEEEEQRKEKGKQTKSQKDMSITTARVIIANDIESEDASLYPLDYNYYIHEAQKWINVIEPSASMQSLF